MGHYNIWFKFLEQEVIRYDLLKVRRVSLVISSHKNSKRQRMFTYYKEVCVIL